MEAARYADRGMPGSVRKRDIEAKIEVQVAQRLVDLLHDAHPHSVALDVFDGWSEVSCADLDGPNALLGSALGFRELAVHRHFIERRGRFDVPQEVDCLDRHIG